MVQKLFFTCITGFNTCQNTANLLSLAKQINLLNICGGYIAVFAFILVILATRENSGNTKHSPGNINFNSVLFTNKNKEIMFVNNIKQAKAIVQHKIH